MYSKVPLLTDPKDHEDPLYLSLDHVKPRGEDEYVVTCRLINDMKTIMDGDEFREMVVGLAAVFQKERRIETPDLAILLKRIKRNYAKAKAVGS
jgi:hypothetical protein